MLEVPLALGESEEVTKWVTMQGGANHRQRTIAAGLRLSRRSGVAGTDVFVVNVPRLTLWVRHPVEASHPLFYGSAFVFVQSVVDVGLLWRQRVPVMVQGY